MVSTRICQNVLFPPSLFVRLNIENVATPKKGIFQEKELFSVVLLWCCYDSQTDMRLVEDRLRDFIDCIVDYNMCAVAFDFVLLS